MHVQFMGGEMHSRIFTLMGLCLDGYAVRLAARPGCAIMHVHLHTTSSGGGMSASGCQPHCTGVQRVVYLSL